MILEVTDSFLFEIYANWKISLFLDHSNRININSGKYGLRKRKWAGNKIPIKIKTKLANKLKK